MQGGLSAGFGAVFEDRPDVVADLCEVARCRDGDGIVGELLVKVAVPVPQLDEPAAVTPDSGRALVFGEAAAFEPARYRLTAASVLVISDGRDTHGFTVTTRHPPSGCFTQTEWTEKPGRTPPKRTFQPVPSADPHRGPDRIGSDRQERSRQGTVVMPSLVMRCCRI